MSTADITSFLCPTRLYMGVGSYVKLKDIFGQYQCERVFVVLDPALAESDYFARVQDLIKDCGIQATTFTGVEPDPTVSSVEKAHAQCAAHGASIVLALGGGSTIDVAKAVAILATNGGHIRDYEGIEKFSTPPMPIIAIPTTAGTGSEVSGSCVITDDESHLKMSIRHAALNPARIAILDPLALRTIPPHVAAHAGIDAFVHAFESFLSLQSNLITDALNLQALNLLANNLRPFVAHAGNLEAGLNMLCGSTLAGITFGQTGLGNVHCMARFIGAFFNLSHGLSNGLCLPHVARFNMIAAPEKHARIAAAMGLPVHGLTTMQAAETAIQGIESLCRDIGIPLRMRDAGVTPDRFDEIARLCTEANYGRWNPRTTSTQDFKRLLEAAY